MKAHRGDDMPIHNPDMFSQSGTALPVAGVAYRCVIFTVLGAAGFRDRMYKCLKSDAGVYNWVELANGGA